MRPIKNRTIGIACSIFRNELRMLQKHKTLHLSFRFLDSMLHMHPSKLDRILRPIISLERKKGNDIVLVYGDCCPYMSEFEADHHVIRVSGKNCCEILLGRESYREWMHRDVFFLMPEWVHKWQEVFQHQLGLTGENAKSFLRDIHTKMVYLDTGLVPVPEKRLKEISRYSGLQVEILQISLDQLVISIQEAEKRL